MPVTMNITILNINIDIQINTVWLQIYQQTANKTLCIIMHGSNAGQLINVPTHTQAKHTQIVQLYKIHFVSTAPVKKN